MAGSVGDGEFGFQIAPMLDILFVLLLFFMVSAGAQKHEASLTTQLPGNKPLPGALAPERIGIDEDGQVSIYGANVDAPYDHKMPQLVSRLQTVVQQHADQPVIITPSRSTKQQSVVDVLNACAAAHVKNLAFGTPTD
jgi:biopolymer transport protein ExbD